jgi:thiol peroxidase
VVQERKNAVTFKGSPLTLIGPKLKAGDKAPDFKLVDTGLKSVTLADSRGKTRLVSIGPSIDTPVCDLQTKRFNQEASKCVAPVIPSCRAHLNVPYGREDRANISQETGTMHPKFPANAAVISVSMDLLFAQAGWCGLSGAGKIQMLSDYQEHVFGRAYGVLIKELRLLSRAVFVLGPDDKVQYVEYVKEVTGHPNYEKVLGFIKTRV